MKTYTVTPISSGSMADIAFLLLIFFLISTTIETDQGILVKLTPYDTPLPAHPQPRNIFSVLINSNNKLLVRGETTEIEDLRRRAKNFIMNPAHDSDLAERPTKAIISLINDRGTKYGTYIQVYNELKAAYNELWDEACRAAYGIPYSNNLSEEIRRDIKKRIPFIISEADPTDFNIEG